MTRTVPEHIEASEHAAEQVIDKLRQAERGVDALSGARSPAIKTNAALGENR